MEDADTAVQVVRRTRANAAGGPLGVRVACGFAGGWDRESLGLSACGGARGAVRRSPMPFDGDGVDTEGIRGPLAAQGAVPPSLLVLGGGRFVPCSEGAESR